MRIKQHDLLVALLEEPRPIADGSCKKAGENEVKFGRIVPRLLNVVHVEGDIWRDSTT